MRQSLEKKSIAAVSTSPASRDSRMFEKVQRRWDITIEAIVIASATSNRFVSINRVEQRQPNRCEVRHAHCRAGDPRLGEIHAEQEARKQLTEKVWPYHSNDQHRVIRNDR
jgi:hypothetical protein